MKRHEWTKEEATQYAKTKWWERLGLSPFEVAYIQMTQPRLGMPWDVFQETVGKALGRPVWTHEFAEPDLLIAELTKKRPTATMEEVIQKAERLMAKKVV